MLLEVTFLLFWLLNIVVKWALSVSLAALFLGNESLVQVVEGTLGQSQMTRCSDPGWSGILCLAL